MGKMQRKYVIRTENKRELIVDSWTQGHDRDGGEKEKSCEKKRESWRKR